MEMFTDCRESRFLDDRLWNEPQFAVRIFTYFRFAHVRY